MKNPDERISAVIITLNEESNIADCLESLLWVDEIVVLDSESTDQTVNIAKQYTDKVFTEKWKGQGTHKNKAIEFAEGTWILSIDADERVTPEMAVEIQDVIRNPAASLYRVRRKNFYKDQWISHCGWWPDWVVRLFKKDMTRFNEKTIHESLVINGPVGSLQSVLEHYSFKTTEDFIERAYRYALHLADDMHSNGVKSSVWRACSHALFSFIKTYIIRRGFLDGSAGLLISASNTVGTFYKYMMLAEKQNKE